jgi:hypothetical protein
VACQGFGAETSTTNSAESTQLNDDTCETRKAFIAFAGRPERGTQDLTRREVRPPCGGDRLRGQSDLRIDSTTMIEFAIREEERFYLTMGYWARNGCNSEC